MVMLTPVAGRATIGSDVHEEPGTSHLASASKARESRPHRKPMDPYGRCSVPYLVRDQERSWAVRPRQHPWGSAMRPDEELVIRAQRGDQAAFAMLATQVGPHFHAVAYRILRDVALTEDAVQEALVGAWRDLPRLRDPARFAAWSYRLLVRVCYAHARRSPRRLPEVPMPDRDIAAPGDDITAVVLRDQLERGFRRLPLDQRTVVVLHHYLGLTAKEIAEVVDSPVETVRTRLKRAMASLRNALELDARPGRVDIRIGSEVAS